MWTYVVREITQLAKYLLCKNQDRDLSPRIRIIKLSVGACPCDPNAGKAEARWTASLAGLSYSIPDAVSENTVDDILRNSSQGCPLASTDTHTHVYIHTSTHMNICIHINLPSVSPPMTS